MRRGERGVLPWWMEALDGKLQCCDFLVVGHLPRLQEVKRCWRCNLEGYHVLFITWKLTIDVNLNELCTRRPYSLLPRHNS